jgi:LysM repeat protein
VKYGDSFAAIAEEFGLSVRRLRSINDLTADYTLT